MYVHKKKKKAFLSTHLYSNIWFLFVFVIYLNSNTSIMFIYIYIYIYIKHYLSGTKEKRKKPYSHHPFPFVFKCLILIYIFYLVEFKYVNYFYKKNTKLPLSKKKPTTSLKNYSFLSRNFYVFFLIFFKTFQNFCYPNSIKLSHISIHPH